MLRDKTIAARLFTYSLRVFQMSVLDISPSFKKNLVSGDNSLLQTNFHLHQQIELCVPSPLYNIEKQAFHDSLDAKISRSQAKRDNCSTEFLNRGGENGLFQLDTTTWTHQHADGIPTPKLRGGHVSCV